MAESLNSPSAYKRALGSETAQARASNAAASRRQRDKTTDPAEYNQGISDNAQGQAQPDLARRLGQAQAESRLLARAGKLLGKDIANPVEAAKSTIRWEIFSALLGVLTTLPALLVLNAMAFFQVVTGHAPLGKFSILEWFCLALANLLTGGLILAIAVIFYAITDIV